jgi:hypothetical protein
LPRLLTQAKPKDCLCEQAAASASADDLITPGRFEFELSRCPSVLIFSMEGNANSQGEHMGAFLAQTARNKSGALCRSHSAAIKQSSEHSEQLIENLTEPKRLGNFCEGILRNSLADF